MLEKVLQDGNNIQKWKSQARLGIYVGHLPHHSGNVAMVLNPETGHVSPQYHVVFDNGFFRGHARLDKIFIYPISTNDQIADIFSKAIPQNRFIRLRKKFLHF